MSASIKFTDSGQALARHLVVAFTRRPLRLIEDDGEYPFILKLPEGYDVVQAKKAVDLVQAVVERRRKKRGQ